LSVLAACWKVEAKKENLVISSNPYDIKQNLA
jgi:hypothetical protein